MGHIFKECPLVKKSPDPPNAPKATKGQAVSLPDCTPVLVPRATIRAASPPLQNVHTGHHLLL